MTNPARILAATRFAVAVHHGQRRRRPAEIPFVDHVLDVAERLSRVWPEDEVLILGGILHDTIEDCDITAGDIRDRFGAEVAALVEEVTDDTTLSRAERKAAQAARVPRASDRAKRIKLADKAANITALARTPPDWSPDRMEDYIRWALRILDPVRGVDPVLEAELDAAIAEARPAIAARR